MSLYDLTYTSRFRDYLPPDKRLPKWLAWTAVFSTPLQWLRDRLFVDYTGGVSYSAWGHFTSYNFGDIVSHKGVSGFTSIYLAVYNGAFSAKTPGFDYGTVYWLLIQDDFIGADERIQYSDQSLCVEYLLNKYFGGNFVQPGSGTSDIYFTYPTFIPQVQPQDYNGSSTYTKGAMISYNGNYYQSLVSSNHAHQPDISPSQWLYSVFPFPYYDASITYSPTKIIQQGAWMFIALQTTVGNAPPTSPSSNAYWRHVTNQVPYNAAETYTLGQLVYYLGNIFMCILTTTGNAPPSTAISNTWFIPADQNTGTSLQGFSVNIPATLYTSLGGTLVHPNPADVIINLLVKRYADAVIFDVIQY